MREPRYEIRRELNGCWTVVDADTGLPAASNGRDLTGLVQEDARDIADVLNRDLEDSRDSPLV